MADDLIVQGPAYSTMCSHQVTTFTPSLDRYIPGSDESDLAFREYLAESGGATGILKALVGILEGQSTPGVTGAQLLAKGLEGWCVPSATRGELVRGEVVEDEDVLTLENESLREKLLDLTLHLDEVKTKLSELLPECALGVTAISATGVRDALGPLAPLLVSHTPLLV